MLDEHGVLSGPDLPDEFLVDLPGETDVRPLREPQGGVQELGFSLVGHDVPLSGK